MNLESNPILFNKLQEKEGFCIIFMNVSQQKMVLQFSNNIVAIDSTHGLNAYDFEVTTLLVVDEWDFLGHVY